MPPPHHSLAAEVVAAAGRVYADGVVYTTPLLHSPALAAAAAPAAPAATSSHDGRGPAHVFLKLECEQATGSFKARGAANRLLALTPAERARGIVTASTGNHALAVAHALRTAPSLRGLPALIFLPRSVAPAKLAKLRAAGAPLCIVDVDDCCGSEAAALAHAVATGAVYVSPYNDVLVAAGQGTAGTEICAQLDAAERCGVLAAADEPVIANHPGPLIASGPAVHPGPLIILVPVGGGGLITGVAAAVKAARPHSLVIGTQPASNACMAQSVAAGRILGEGAFTDGPTLSDGTAGGIEADSFTFDACAAAAVGADAVAAVIERERRRLAEVAAAAADLRDAGAARSSISGSLSALDVASNLPHCVPSPDPPLVDGLLTVSETAIETAIVAVLLTHNKVIEGAAGTAVAALLQHGGTLFAGCTVVVLLCGSNIAPAKLWPLVAKHGGKL